MQFSAVHTADTPVRDPDLKQRGHQAHMIDKRLDITAPSHNKGQESKSQDDSRPYKNKTQTAK